MEDYSSLKSLIVTHILTLKPEDDLRPAILFALLNKVGYQTLVYLINNLSNHPLFLRWAGVSVKKHTNLVRTQNVLTAAIDFGKRLERGEL